MLGLQSSKTILRRKNTVACAEVTLAGRQACKARPSVSSHTSSTSLTQGSPRNAFRAAHLASDNYREPGSFACRSKQKTGCGLVSPPQVGVCFLWSFTTRHLNSFQLLCSEPVQKPEVLFNLSVWGGGVEREREKERQGASAARCPTSVRNKKPVQLGKNHCQVSPLKNKHFSMKNSTRKVENMQLEHQEQDPHWIRPRT